jgi:hypothetical protein
MNRRRVAFALLFVCSALLCTCDHERPLAPTFDTGQLEIEVRWPVVKPLIAAYDSLVVVVSGGDMVPIRKVFPIVGKQVHWLVNNVPVGRRTVELEVMGRRPEDRQSIVLYRGSSEVTVLKEQTQKAVVEVRAPEQTVWVQAGSLRLSAATLVVGDTLRVEVQGAASSHTRPLYQCRAPDMGARSL